MVESALEMRDVMKAAGLNPWPKLTGGKGIHLIAPLEPRISHDRAHKLARRLASELAARQLGQYVLSAKADRNGRIFLDYLRNGRGTTVIGTYSPRVRDGFPIAAPVTWAKVRRGIAPNAFTMSRPLGPA